MNNETIGISTEIAIADFFEVAISDDYRSRGDESIIDMAFPIIDKQKKIDGKCFVSTVLFDNESEVIHDRVKLENVKPMTDRDYTVRGCTALLDARSGND